MAEVIQMPRLSDTMTEGVIVVWHKKVGDTVNSGDLLADVETDKATMELETFSEGKLLHIGVQEGETVPINTVIAIVGEDGEDIDSLIKDAAKSSGGSTPEESEIKEEEVIEKVVEKVVPSSNQGGRVFASPLAKKIASDSGVDIKGIVGTGDEGRVIKRDVETAIANGVNSSVNSASIPTFSDAESYSDQAISQMRKTISKRLSESKFTAPHFYLKMTVNMNKAIEARNSINAIAPVKISFNDMMVKAVAVALKQHPTVNSAWLGDKIRTYNHVNIGIAVAVEDGLLVPVIRFADGKTLSQISAETKTYAQKAKDKQLQPSDWEGNTFTISNLGMYGIDEFTAIINTPDSCILAVGGINQVPVVKDGSIVSGNEMKLTLSCDHRVVDGASGAMFLQTLKSLLEDPIRLLV